MRLLAISDTYIPQKFMQQGIAPQITGDFVRWAMSKGATEDQVLNALPNAWAAYQREAQR